MEYGEVWVTNKPMAAQSLIDKCQTCLCIEDDWFMTYYLNNLGHFMAVSMVTIIFLLDFYLEYYPNFKYQVS